MSGLKKEDQCPDCLAWHGRGNLKHLEPGVPCGHDQERPCKLCGHPVGGLSIGGPGICCWCDSGGLPEATLMERQQEAARIFAELSEFDSPERT